jgi:hypothetical protein
MKRLGWRGIATILIGRHSFPHTHTREGTLGGTTMCHKTTDGVTADNPGRPAVSRSTNLHIHLQTYLARGACSAWVDNPAIESPPARMSEEAAGRENLQRKGKQGTGNASRAATAMHDRTVARPCRLLNAANFSSHPSNYIGVWV